VLRRVTYRLALGILVLCALFYWAGWQAAKEEERT
jgi:hypothetical protein